MAGIEKKVKHKLDIVISNRRLRNVKALDLAIEDVLEQLTKNKDNESFGVINPKDLSKLVVAQDHLLGRGAADEEQTAISEEAKASLKLLTDMPADTIAQLANVLAEKMTPPDNIARRTEKLPHI